MSLSVAIDFTASNGQITDETSLHAAGANNDYTKLFQWSELVPNTLDSFCLMLEIQLCNNTMYQVDAGLSVRGNLP